MTADPYAPARRATNGGHGCSVPERIQTRRVWQPEGRRRVQRRHPTRTHRARVHRAGSRRARSRHPQASQGSHPMNVFQAIALNAAIGLVIWFVLIAGAVRLIGAL